MKLFTSLKTKFVVWVWNHTPTCAEMSRLTSRAFEQPLPLKMRIRMRLHFAICAWCRRYFEQLNFLHRSAPRLSRRVEELPGAGMSAEMKRRIALRIKAEL